MRFAGLRSHVRCCDGLGWCRGWDCRFAVACSCLGFDSHPQGKLPEGMDLASDRQGYAVFQPRRSDPSSAESSSCQPGLQRRPGDRSGDENDAVRRREVGMSTA